jgi:molybdenum cofactor cytidylyltransferase
MAEEPAPPAQAAAIVLAAGHSSRLGRAKQFVEFSGQTLLVRTVRSALDAGASPVWVVLSGNLTQAGRTALAAVDAEIVENPEAAEGMGSSLRVGMAALLSADPLPERVLLLVCDQPLLTAGHLRRLLQTPSPHGITAAAYEGRLGVPAVFGQEHYAALAESRGDAGARDLLRSLPVTALELPEASIDIDTPEQLRALLDP